MGSTYWNVIHGREQGEAILDAEGVQTMHNVANNMAWILNCIETICEVLADGDGVMFRGFGCFDVRDRAARTTTSPSTGEKIDIPATRGVHFAVGANLKRYVREGMKAE